MGMGLFGISMSGISAAQKGLEVTQHNIANATTEGYSRQSTVQATIDGVGTGAGYFGRGVEVSTVRRQYDEFLSGQVNQAQSSLSAYTASAGQLDSIDQMLADTTTSVLPALNNFFSAAQQVSSYPSSLAVRQSMVAAAQNVVNRFNNIGARISNLNDQTNQQLVTGATSLNSYAQQMVEINQQINRSAISNQAPNDLLDKREQIIAEMSKLADISTTLVTTTGKTNDYGSIQVYLGGNHLLVGENTSYAVQAKASSVDPQEYSLYVNGQEVGADEVTGGTLGGLLTARSGPISLARNELGRVAYALSSTFNAQHATGMDLLGNNVGDANFQADFFTIPTTVAATSNNQTAPALTISLSSPALTSSLPDGYYQTNLTTSDYTLAYSGSYTLTRLSDAKTWTGASIAAINTQLTGSNDQGFTLNLSGTPPTNTTYLIRPSADMATDIGMNTAIVADVRLVAAGLAVKAAVPSTNTGSMNASVTRMESGKTSSTLPLTLTYTAATQTLSGFFPGATNVVVTSTSGASTTYTSGTVPYQAGATYTISKGTNGVSLQITGTPGNNDTVVLSQNDISSIGVSDSSNMLLLNRLQSQKVIGGLTSYAEGYAQMVSNVGSSAGAAQSMQESQQTLLEVSKSSRDGLSGVNLDEEAANLILYQQMYVANAKALQAGQKLFDALLAIMN